MRCSDVENCDEKWEKEQKITDGVADKHTIDVSMTNQKVPTPDSAAELRSSKTVTRYGEASGAKSRVWLKEG